ncbi:MAG TPA: ABC transporter substrate-binding protein [Xanthobacteraceae bacterium]|nr:ABC transporter substrate-binding protein [Xanthobacteraceae bacterium]
MRMIIAAGAAVAALLGLSTAGAAEPVTLRYGQIANSARSVSSLALTVAQRKGFLAQEGIDLKVVGLAGTSHQVEALDRGEVELSHTALPYLVEAVLKGSHSVGIVGAPANTIYSLMAQPQIKSFADLRGKLIGLSLPIDTISIATRMLLQKHGLGDQDYHTKELVGTPIRAKCLEGGECAAVPLGQPDDIVAAQKGFAKLGDSLEVIPRLQFSVIAARRDWAEANRDAVLHFTRAFAAAYRFMRAPENREEMTRIAADTTGAPPDIARAVLDFFYEPDRGVMPKQAEIDMAGVDAVIALLGQTGELSAPLPAADRFVDVQYLKAAGLE